MIDIPEHARKEMEDDDITEEEVRWCLEQGEKEMKTPHRPKGRGIL